MKINSNPLLKAVFFSFFIFPQLLYSQCNDGIDNDGDGLIDWQQDLGCYGAGDTTETGTLGPNGSGQLEEGWTTFNPSPDTRIIYVTSSQEGSDNYTGLCPDRPNVGNCGPKQTIDAGYALLRDGYPDWLLFRRGDVWISNDLNGPPFLTLRKSGRSANERMVIGSYGGSTERPRWETGFRQAFSVIGNSFVGNYALVDLHFYSRHRDPSQRLFSGPTAGFSAIAHTNTPAANILFENNKVEFYGIGMAIQGVGVDVHDVSIRRNIITDGYGLQNNIDAQGLYCAGLDPGRVLAEENVFIQNGWNPDIPINSTQHEHNVYISEAQNGADFVFRGNIAALGGSHGLMVRPGGVVENNLLLKNAINLLVRANDTSLPGFQDLTVTNNVILGGRDIDSANLRGWGMEIKDASQGLVSRNIVAHADNISQNSLEIPAGGFQLTNTRFAENVFYNWEGRNFQPYHNPPALDFQNNKVWPQTMPFGSNVSAQTFAFPDPNRTISTYMTSLGETGSLDVFLAQVRQQSKWNWRQEYTAGVVNDYIRQGFGVPTLGAIVSVPLAPSRLRTLNPTTGSLQLVWNDNSNNELGFRVERSEDNQLWTRVVDDLPSNQNHFVDSGLSAGTPYSYRVVAFNSRGASAPSNVTSGTTRRPPSQSRFPFGVWLQNPIENFTMGGTNRTVSAAAGFASLSFTHWMGLWKWPSEQPPDREPGYNVPAAQELKNYDFKVIAGEDQRAIDWIHEHPEFGDTFIGYLAGDEPEMNKWSPWNTAGTIWDLPDNFRERARILLENDGTREVYGNFGKPFGVIPGVYFPTGLSLQEDFDKYIENLTFASVDVYGLTDPYQRNNELPMHAGIWVYGEAVKSLITHRNNSSTNRNLPIWGVVETGTPFDTSGPNGRIGLYQSMPPELIKPTVWNMIVNGAVGIFYFVHDFTPGFNTHPLSNPVTYAAVSDTNNSINAFADILNRPLEPGLVVTEDGPVKVPARTHRFGNDIYIFAQGSGNPYHIYGHAVNATFQVPSGGNKTVEVLNENRQVSMVNGIFSDHFEPYQLHIYKVTDNPTGGGGGPSGTEQVREFKFIPCNNPKEQGATPKICMEMPQGDIEIKILNARTGRDVRTLLKETRDAGSVEIVWDGKDYSGTNAASGVYTVVGTHNGGKAKRFKLPLVR